MNERLEMLLGSIQFCPVCTRRLFADMREMLEFRLYCDQDGHGIFIVTIVDDEWKIEYQMAED